MSITDSYRLLLPARFARGFRAREDQVFSLDGDIWRVVIEDNDCDLHVELSAHGRADQVFGMGGPRAFQFGARVSF